MKFYFLFFLFLLITLNGVLATGFSPGSLIFELEQNQEECKTITIMSESDSIEVNDIWAENKDVEWKVSLFEKDSNYHNIDINYNNQLVIEERSVDVCLSGSEIGEYHGVILLKQEQEGNSVVQMGVWLKVTISEKQQTPLEEPTITTTNENSGGGSGGGNIIEELIEDEENSEEIIDESKEEVIIEEEIEEGINDKTSAKITGASIGFGEGNWNIITITGIVILGVIGFTVIKRYRVRKLKKEI